MRTNYINDSCALRFDGHIFVHPQLPLKKYNDVTLRAWSYQVKPYTEGEPIRDRKSCLEILFEKLQVAKMEHCGILSTVPFTLFELVTSNSEEFKTLKEYLKSLFKDKELYSIIGQNMELQKSKRKQSVYLTEKQRRGNKILLQIYENVKKIGTATNSDFLSVSMRVLYSEKGAKQQMWHRDPNSVEAAPGAYPVISFIIAIMDGTSLCFRNKDGTTRKVRIPPGFGLAFRSDRVHSGSEYNVPNIRLFAVIKKRSHRLQPNRVIVPKFCPNKNCGKDFFLKGDLKEHLRTCPFQELKKTITKKA